MSRAAAIAAVAAAGVAAACDGGADEGPAPGPPSAPELMTQSLTEARREQRVHFKVRLELGMRVEGRHRSYVVTAEAERTESGLRASGKAGGNAFEVVEAKGRLFLELGGVWYSVPTNFRTILSAESFMDFVPESACLDGGSAGCTRVDLGRPLRNGEFGRLLNGTVRALDDAWELRGTLDAAGFAKLLGRPDSRYYRPYETNGEARFVAGKDDLLPREFSYHYRLDRSAIAEHLQEPDAPPGLEEQSARIELAFSEWGELRKIEAPVHARPAPDRLLERLFEGYAALFGSFL